MKYYDRVEAKEILELIQDEQYNMDRPSNMVIGELCIAIKYLIDECGVMNAPND